MANFVYTPTADLVSIREHNGHHKLGAGDDFIFVRTGGFHEIDGGPGIDLVVLDGKVTGYYVAQKQPNMFTIWGGDVSLDLTDVENLLLRTKTDAAHVFDLGQINSDAVVFVSMSRDKAIIANRQGEVIYAVNDGSSVKSGPGDDHLVATGHHATLLLEGDVKSYGISKRDDDGYLFQSEIDGSDYVKGFDYYSFNDGTLISAGELPYLTEQMVELIA